MTLLEINFDEFSNHVCIHMMMFQKNCGEDIEGLFCSARDILDNNGRDRWPHCCESECPLWKRWRVKDEIL